CGSWISAASKPRPAKRTERAALRGPLRLTKPIRLGLIPGCTSGGPWGSPCFGKGRGNLRMTIFRRLGLALVAVAALAVWLASGAMAESRQIPIGGTGSAQTGDFTPSGSGDVTQDEFPTSGESEQGPDP